MEEFIIKDYCIKNQNSECKLNLNKLNEKIGFVPEILTIIESIDSQFINQFMCCDSKIFTDGALSAKTKILISLALVASKQCDECVCSQMKNALKYGVTKEEIMETLSVIMIISGATAVASCRKALRLLIDK